MKTKLLVLNDHEGELAAAPALTDLQNLADVTIMDRPIAPDDYPTLAQYQVIFALRERTNLDEAFFVHCPSLELILQSGGHAYHLDQEAASKRGILVALGRGAKRPMVIIPELTFGLILGLTRRIYPLHQQMVQGEWPEEIGGSIYGRTLGILGYGRHGKPIAQIARGFGMKIAAWDRGGDYSADEPDVTRLPIDQLMATSDVVSVHLRLSDDSQGLISRELLYKMKPTALLINTSRGAIVDEAALIDLLSKGRIAGAGLDVFSVEPLAADSPLRTLPNVLLTPHIGWKVNDMLHEWMEIAVSQLESYLAGSLGTTFILNPEAIEVGRKRSGGILNS
ncbi:MAG: NAD(P)-dependent oxidoreductase [Chloroflexota bacterium]